LSAMLAILDDSLDNVEGVRASSLRVVHVRSIADVRDSLRAILG